MPKSVRRATPRLGRKPSLTEAQVRMLRAAVAGGQSLSEVAATVGISVSHAHDIVNRRRYAWVK